MCVPGATGLREWASPAWVSHHRPCRLTPTLLLHNNWLHCLFFFFFVLPADVDECLQSPNPCAYQCRNVPGTFRCVCPPGTVLLGDGRSCAGLERGVAFSNGTRVRARLRPQLVSSLGRPILSRAHGASRITRQSCPVGYTTRDGTCVGKLSGGGLRGGVCVSSPVSLMVPHQMWTSASSGSPVSTSVGTR